MEDGTDYNIFSFRDKKNRVLPQYSNILSDTNSTFSQHQFNISRKKWWRNQQTSHLYTTEWEIILPDRRDTFFVKANMNNQELSIRRKLDFLPSYWEGACTVLKKTANGKLIKGVGFAEHFPYRGKKEFPWFFNVIFFHLIISCSRSNPELFFLSGIFFRQQPPSK